MAQGNDYDGRNPTWTRPLATLNQGAPNQYQGPQNVPDSSGYDRRPQHVSYQINRDSGSQDRMGFRQRKPITEEEFDRRLSTSGYGTGPPSEQPDVSVHSQPHIVQPQSQRRNRTEFKRVTFSRYQMPNFYSYHKEISGEEGERRLRGKGGVCFLTRFSTNQDKYVLSVISSEGKVLHLEIEIDKDIPQFSLRGTEQPFQSMEELFKYYQTNPLSPSHRSIGAPCYSPEVQCCRRVTNCLYGFFLWRHVY